MAASIRSFLLILTLLGAVTSSQAATSPNYRALIVGVSEYPGLARNLSLEGPKNDAARMREVLISRGVPAQNITVLADGISGAGMPTRRQILAALDQLARTARADDYIIIHMAGHGSQQPVPDDSPYAVEEHDGLFEIFLPRDVEGWADQKNGSGGEVRNAILDHEIRAVVDRMTASGAFVWAIFDTCHSATLVRSAGNSEVKLRQVMPADLGIPDRALASSVRRATMTGKGRGPDGPAAGSGKPGRAVYFYAAQTHEPAPEMRLPAGEPDRVSHGLFSYTIMQALDGGAGMTYQQLAQQVLTLYAGNGEARATPLFSGTALQSGVLGQATSSPRQWPVNSGNPLSIPAGELSDLHVGAILALLPSALARTEDAVAYAQIIRTSAIRSELAPVAFGGHPAQSEAEMQKGRIARLARPAMQFSLIVTTDLSQCAQPCPFSAALTAMRSGDTGDTGVTGDRAGPRVKWVDAGQSAQLVLKADGRRLWLMPSSLQQAAMPDQPEKLMVFLDAAANASSQGIRNELQRMLNHARKASNLMRVAGTLSSAVGALEVKLSHVSAAGATTAMGGASVPAIRAGDKVFVEMTNTGRKALDVTALYLDSQYGVIAMFPSPGASNRLAADSKSVTFGIDITDSTLGVERLLFIAVEAENKADRADYSFLAQQTLSSEIVTRGRTITGDGGDAQFFRDAGFGDYVTRGGSPAATPSATGIQVYTWQVVQ